MITEIIETLQKGDHFNVGKTIEIAKGKNEFIYTFKDFKRKIKRQWRLRN